MDVKRASASVASMLQPAEVDLKLSMVGVPWKKARQQRVLPLPQPSLRLRPQHPEELEAQHPEELEVQYPEELEVRQWEE